jgi:O-antigen/teichoic acid export membrane protein
MNRAAAPLDRVRRWRAPRFVVDTATLQTGQVLALAAQAVTGLVALRILGPESFGVYSLSVAATAMLGLLDPGGANRVAIVEVAKARAAGGELTEALASHVRLSLQVWAPLVAAFMVAAPAAATWAFGRADVGYFARWLALGAMIEVPISLLIVVLQGRREMPRLVRFESARALAGAGLAIGALLAGAGVAGLVAARLATGAGAAVVAARAYARLGRADPTVPAWTPLLRAARHVPIATRLRLGLSIAFEKGLGNVGAQLPLLALGVLAPAAAGYYSAALRVVGLPYPLVSALARNLDVVLAAHAGTSAARVRASFLRSTAYAAAIWTGVTAIVGAVAPWALVFLGGPAYAPAVPAVVPLLAQSVAVGAGVGVAAALRAVGQAGWGVGLQIASLLVGAAAAAALIPPLGAVGGAWAHALRYWFLTLAGVWLVLWRVQAGAAGDRAAASSA